jgi:hypothetical protein
LFWFPFQFLVVLQPRHLHPWNLKSTLDWRGDREGGSQAGRLFGGPTLHCISSSPLTA